MSTVKTKALAFRALAYGILPTIFAQWLAVASLAYLVATWQRNWRWEWLGVTLLLALALDYTSRPTTLTTKGMRQYP